ncbi:MAG: beta-ketoacyl synthase chain length factor [Alphaproteobacteria bacterium]|nr:beta-ketoacyl synthase chain length factor [Alphaproteobacteria bacterium]
MNNTIGLDKFYIWRESDDEKLPDVSFIPPMTRRRMTDLQKIVVGISKQVVPDNACYQVVFASRYGEWRQTIKLITQFHTESEMSPAGFSNSVHNAAAGAFSILTENKNSYISIAAGIRTLESGVLAALTAEKPVLFVFAEEKSPEMYEAYLNKPVLAQGLAFMLSDSGRRKISWTANHDEYSPLTFDAMADFLVNGGELVTSCWKMGDR